MLERVKIKTDEHTSKLLHTITERIEDAIESGFSSFDSERLKTAVNDSLDEFEFEVISGKLEQNSEDVSTLKTKSGQLYTLIEGVKKNTDKVFEHVKVSHEKNKDQIENLKNDLLEVNRENHSEIKDMQSKTNKKYISVLDGQKNLCSTIEEKKNELKESQNRAKENLTSQLNNILELQNKFSKVNDYRFSELIDYQDRNNEELASKIDELLENQKILLSTIEDVKSEQEQIDNYLNSSWFKKIFKKKKAKRE